MRDRGMQDMELMHAIISVTHRNQRYGGLAVEQDEGKFSSVVDYE